MLTRRKILRAASVVAAVAAALTLALWVGLTTGEIRLPKRMVLRATVPHSPSTLELWERPGLDLIVWEYETWLVVRSAGQARWCLIDNQYITFTDVALLLSPDLHTVSIEVGKGAGAYVVAEYDLTRQRFQEESEASVRNRKGWTVLAAAHIH